MNYRTKSFLLSKIEYIAKKLNTPAGRKLPQSEKDFIQKAAIETAEELLAGYELNTIEMSNLRDTLIDKIGLDVFDVMDITTAE